MTRKPNDEPIVFVLSRESGVTKQVFLLRSSCDSPTTRIRLPWFSDKDRIRPQ